MGPSCSGLSALRLLEEGGGRVSWCCEEGSQKAKRGGKQETSSKVDDESERRKKRGPSTAAWLPTQHLQPASSFTTIITTIIINDLLRLIT